MRGAAEDRLRCVAYNIFYTARRVPLFLSGVNDTGSAGVKIILIIINVGIRRKTQIDFVALKKCNNSIQSKDFNNSKSQRMKNGKIDGSGFQDSLFDAF